MRKTDRESRFVAVCVGILMLLNSGVSAAEFELEGSAEVGWQGVDLSGEKPSKFGEYREVPDGFLLEDFFFAGSKNADLYFRIEGRDATQDDQSYSGEAGKYGKFKLRLQWDEIPHFYSNGGRFLGSELSDGVWCVPDIIQQTLEPDFPLGGDPPLTSTATGVANLQDLISHAQGVKLKVDRETGKADLILTPFRNFNLFMGYSHENREGFRALSAGAYRRDPDGAFLVGGVGENFRLYGLEFPEPVDYDINEINGGINYRQENWHADLSYKFTSFANRIDTVTWDNPLLFTGVDSTQGGAAINRLDLPPDSMSHSLNLTAGVSDLPLKTKITGTVAWDRVEQDDDFLAYTVNRAVLDDQGRIAADLPLPESNLDGAVTTIVVNGVLNSRPMDPLALTLKYNRYEYDNESDRITWDGWVGIGETTWMDHDGAGTNEQAFTNRVPEYTRDRASIDAVYTINPMIALQADYTYEKYDRNEDRSADTQESIYGGSIKMSPIHWATFRLGYHRAERDIGGTYTAEIGLSNEWEELRQFDQAERDRDIVDALLSFYPTERLSIGLSFRYNDDDYDTTFYGLQETKGYMGGLDVSYMVSDRVTLYANYTRDRFEDTMKARTKSDAAGGGAFEVPENDFVSELRDTTDTMGGGAFVTLIPGKLTLGLGAHYSRAIGEIETQNPNFVPGITTTGATARSWPDTEAEIIEIGADLQYNWTDRVSIGLRYLYERLDLNDFAFNLLEPYGNPDDIQGGSLSHFIFMDANYSGYKAHVLAATLRYEF